MLCISDCGFPEPSLIWVLPRWEIECSVSNFPGTISRASDSSPNIVGADAAGPCSGCRLTPAISSILQSHTSNGNQGSNWQCPSIPVLSLRQASSKESKHCYCTVVLFRRLRQAPSQIHYLHSACPAVCLHPHILYLPHPHHRQTI